MTSGTCGKMYLSLWNDEHHILPMEKYSLLNKIDFFRRPKVIVKKNPRWEEGGHG